MSNDVILFGGITFFGHLRQTLFVEIPLQHFHHVPHLSWNVHLSQTNSSEGFLHLDLY